MIGSSSIDNLEPRLAGGKDRLKPELQSDNPGLLRDLSNPVALEPLNIECRSFPKT